MEPDETSNMLPEANANSVLDATESASGMISPLLDEMTVEPHDGALPQATEHDLKCKQNEGITSGTMSTINKLSEDTPVKNIDTVVVDCANKEQLSSSEDKTEGGT